MPGAYHRVAVPRRRRRPGLHRDHPPRAAARLRRRWWRTPTTSATSRCSARTCAPRCSASRCRCIAHPLAEPDKGSGIAMVCTFGDLTDVTWWRELQLPTRAIIGRDGRLLRDAAGVDHDAEGAPRTPSWPARPRSRAQETRGRAAREAGGSTASRSRSPTRSTSSRRATSRSRSSPPASGTSATAAATRSCATALIGRGQEIDWHPAFMRHRYENWVAGLNGDWLVSRQRFFGVPIPVWYPLDAAGEPDYEHPLAAPRGRAAGGPGRRCPAPATTNPSAACPAASSATPT